MTGKYHGIESQIPETDQQGRMLLSDPQDYPGSPAGKRLHGNSITTY